MYDLRYVMMVMLPGLIISGLASWLVQSTFRRYSRVGTRRGYTGAQAAQQLLDQAGIRDVSVVMTQGFLSDHYNPVTRQLALSPDVYRGSSIAAIGVATHEAGHAIQHAHAYAPLTLRSALVPTVGIGSQLGMLGMMFGAMMGFKPLVLLGAVLFSAVLAFQLVTLPVEFDATSRAKRLVVEAGIVDSEERYGMDRVLRAAALTYVAAVLTSLLTLFYYLMRSGLLGGNRDE